MHQILRVGLYLAGLGCSLIGCHDSSPPARPAGEPSHAAVLSTPPAPLSSAPAGGASAPEQRAGSLSDAFTPAPPTSETPAQAGSQPAVVPDATLEGGNGAPLLDREGKPLPQTDERPTVSSPAFQRRVEALAMAIVSGEPHVASSAFFPLVAYAQVKDVAKPERDFRFRLLANFERDVRAYHRALGSSAPDAKLARITVSERDVAWMAPGSEGNKLGYYRVLRSQLRFTLPAGRSRDFEVTSLISWRGEWYIVHLHGFK